MPWWNAAARSSAVLATRTLHAGPVGSGQAGAALGDFLRGAEILAASEAMRIGQRFGLDPQSVVEIGETLSGVGPAMGSLLREQVLTRKFDTGLALGHVLKGLEITERVARSAGVHAPLAGPMPGGLGGSRVQESDQAPIRAS